MAKSAHLLEEDSSWTQTFFIVTPQDDGFLREIEDTAIVSGNADVPLNLDTGNIVLRRSLLNTTKDVIDLKELEEPESIETECQTYLQGVPKVDLPLVYRDEATQTLYIGKDEKAPFDRAFEDVIAVMNDKPLPKWKKSENVQTKITFENTAPFDDIIQDLQTNIVDTDLKKSDPMISAGVIESSDALNFMVERALWMSEPVAVSEVETKEADTETMIKYDNALKKFMIDHEVQTDLSWDPKFSNSMLLSADKENTEIVFEKHEGDNGSRYFLRETLDSGKNKIYNESKEKENDNEYEKNENDDKYEENKNNNEYEKKKKSNKYEENLNDDKYEENENDDEYEENKNNNEYEKKKKSNKYEENLNDDKYEENENDDEYEENKNDNEYKKEKKSNKYEEDLSDDKYEENKNVEQTKDFDRKTIDTKMKTVLNRTTKNRDIAKKGYRGKTERIGASVKKRWKLSSYVQETPRKWGETQDFEIHEPSGFPPTYNWGVQKTEHILLTSDKSYVSRNRDEAAEDPNLQRACSSRETMISYPIDSTSSYYKVSDDISSSSLYPKISPRPSTECREKLPARDERALKSLEEALCPKKLERCRGTCRCSGRPERRIISDY